MQVETPSTADPTHEAGDYLTWMLVAALGLLGPVMAHQARDNEIYLFGLSLFCFAAIFLFFEVKRHYDVIDAAHEAAVSEAPGE